MNRYYMIRRLRWPAALLLAGVVSLLHKMDVLNSFWHWFIPLWLILLGILMLAERVALANEDGYLPPYSCANPYPAQGNPYPGAPNSGPVWTDAAGAPPTGQTGSAIVTTYSHELTKDAKDSDGGQK